MSDGTPWVLAIDLGTSYSLAASQRLGGAAEVLEIGGLRRVPSIVYADDGGPVVGRVALELASSAPARAIRTPKRRLGDPTPAILGGRPHDVTDLVAALLRHIHGEAVRHHGSAPALVRLTHPARWGTARRRGLVAAAERAGLGRVELVAEPVAAAVAYAREARVPVGARVLVYDLGGGTFDTAVLQASADGFDVLGEPGGDETIGGELFDELLVAEVAERALEPDVREQLLTSDDDLWRRAAVLLQSEVCRVKELLSEHPSTDCLVSLPVGMVSERITRDDLRTIVEPYLAETMEVVRDTLAMAGVDVADLAAVHLAGGASRMPLVAELVAETLPGVPLSRRGDPKAAVALGAVLLGAPADRPLGADRVAGGGGSEDDEETVIAAAAAPEAGPVARTAAAAADA
ncbi:MAG: Hsp70 family protein, partial [Actinomycetota bacterium]|nr:Hsp70 family protein [Actinomycetota bacterium]